MERLRRALRKFSVSFARRIKRRAGLQAKSKRGLEPRVGHRSTTDIPPSADKNPSRRLNLFPRAWCRKRGVWKSPVERAHTKNRRVSVCFPLPPFLPFREIERYEITATSNGTRELVTCERGDKKKREREEKRRRRRRRGEERVR